MLLLNGTIVLGALTCLVLHFTMYEETKALRDVIFYIIFGLSIVSVMHNLNRH